MRAQGWGPHATSPERSPLWFQALKYLDYIFTGVFTFEMVIKVRRRLPTACMLLTLSHGPLGGVTSWRHGRGALRAQQGEGTPRSFTPALGQLPSATLVPTTSSQGSPSPHGKHGAQPILSTVRCRRGGGHGAGRTEPTHHSGGP